MMSGARTAPVTRSLTSCEIMNGIPKTSVARSFCKVKEGQKERRAVPASVSRSQRNAQRASAAPK